jgi:hypothetical protein
MPTARAKYERYKGRLTPSTSRSLLLTLAPAQKIQRRGGQFGLPMPWGRNAGKRKRPGKLIRAEAKMEVQGWTVWHSCVSGVFRHGGHLVSCSRRGLSFVHNGHAPARGGPAWGARAGTDVGHGGVTHVCLATKEASGKPGRAEPRWPRLRASQQSFQPACSARKAWPVLGRNPSTSSRCRVTVSFEI